MKIVVIDINNIIYRAYFGIQQPLRAPNGQLVNAVYGVFNMIHRIVVDYHPDKVIIAKDSRVSLRKEEYAEYKQNRSKMPDDLRGQIDLIYELLGLLNFQMIEVEGYEADDVINAVAKTQLSDSDSVFIVSSDKDLMQLVNTQVRVLDTMKQKEYGPEDVLEKMGVLPSGIVDYLALLGDSSDNIPGVKGIGEKTASKLINQYGSLENILSQVPSMPEGKVKTVLSSPEGQSLARLSYSLASLKMVNLPELKNFSLTSEQIPALEEYFKKLNMKSALTKLAGMIK